MLDVYGTNIFNLIQDDDFYYVFRALNSGDQDDIVSGKSTDGLKIVKVRTDGDRWSERHDKKSEYDGNTVPTLQEVWDHIRENHSYQTNCISFTTNGNVVLDYGTGNDHNKRYILMKIPKNNPESDTVFFAGKYMLEKLLEAIDSEIAKIPNNSEILEIIREIENSKESSEIRACIVKRYDSMILRNSTDKYKSKRLVQKKKSVTDRFKQKSYLSDEQQLEYNKIVGKLTVMEFSNKYNFDYLLVDSDENMFLKELLNSENHAIVYQSITDKQSDIIHYLFKKIK